MGPRRAKLGVAQCSHHREQAPDQPKAYECELAVDIGGDDWRRFKDPDADNNADDYGAGFQSRSTPEGKCADRSRDALLCRV